MAETPPRSFPTLREGTMVPISIGLLVAIITAAVLFTAWLTVMNVHIQSLIESVERLQKDVSEIKERKP